MKHGYTSVLNVLQKTLKSDKLMKVKAYLRLTFAFDKQKIEKTVLWNNTNYFEMQVICWTYKQKSTNL